MSSEVAELERAVYVLPEGWRRSALAGVADISRGTSWGRDNEHRHPIDGALPVLGIRNVQARLETNDLVWLYGLKPSSITSSTVQMGDILMVGSNGNPARIGNAVQVDEPGRFLYASLLFGLRPRRDTVDPDFLYYAIVAPGVQSAISDAVQGTTGLSNLKITTLRDLPIDLPPLDEQRRIAEVLRSVDEAIAAAQAALTANDTVHRLLLDALFGICFSVTDSGNAATIGQVCDRVTYGFTNPMPTTDEGPWMLTAANVRHGWIDYNSARHTSPTAYANDISDKSRPPIGAVLVTKDGTLGRVARVDRGDVCINQSVAVLIPSVEEIDGGFLSYLLQSPTGQERMLADSGGSSVKHIYISKLAEMPFALPPMEVQQERAVLAEESERAVREQTSAVEALSVLKSDLMSDLLSGRVRVPE